MKQACVAVAYSGGRDSTALLHATLRAARPLGVEVVALHVHHGLSPQADAWLAHCETQCLRWARRGWPVRLAARRLQAQPQRGESIEAWARDARYAALAVMAREEGASAVMLAHHRRDQAETLLLQALRGAGLAGLSAMPRQAQRAGIAWLRPWLDRPREAIDRYVRRWRLEHVEDESNADRRFARNRLRTEVWPALLLAFPSAEATLSDAAAWAQEADICLAELAALDLAQVATARGLKLEAWLALSTSRRANALRAWLKLRLGAAVPSSLVCRLAEELPAAVGPARWPLGQGALCRYRGWLRFEPQPEGACDAMRQETVSLKRAGLYTLRGWGGQLRARRVARGGAALAGLLELRLVERGGGEQFQFALDRPPRSLKKQYQALGIPAWEREGPLLVGAQGLVFVPGLGIDARARAQAGEPQLALEWVAGPARPARQGELLRCSS